MHVLNTDYIKVMYPTLHESIRFSVIHMHTFDPSEKMVTKYALTNLWVTLFKLNVSFMSDTIGDINIYVSWCMMSFATFHWYQSFDSGWFCRTNRAMGGGVSFREALEARLQIVKPSRQQLAEFIQQHPPHFSPNVQ